LEARLLCRETCCELHPLFIHWKNNLFSALCCCCRIIMLYQLVLHTGELQFFGALTLIPGHLWKQVWIIRSYKRHYHYNLQYSWYSTSY